MYHLLIFDISMMSYKLLKLFTFFGTPCIVCSYCSIVCLIIKSGSKMVKISNASYENEIHMVDSPISEDSKNINFFAREALILREGRPENLGIWPKTGKHIVMQIRE